jgi:hypothetical protein
MRRVIKLYRSAGRLPRVSWLHGKNEFEGFLKSLSVHLAAHLLARPDPESEPALAKRKAKPS